VWLKPQIVTEIMADEITKSPIHKPDEATSRKELEKLFKLQ